MKSSRSGGIARERQLRNLLDTEGWWTCRAAGSFGNADLVALRNGDTPRLIEVKTSPRGPFHSFGPLARRELSMAARTAAAEAWLVWWPPRKQPVWLPESKWPYTDGP